MNMFVGYIAATIVGGLIALVVTVIFSEVTSSNDERVTMQSVAIGASVGAVTGKGSCRPDTGILSAGAKGRIGPWGVVSTDAPTIG